LICGLLLAVVAALGWSAYLEVRRSALLAARERTAGVARLLADLLQASPRARLAETGTVARAPAVVAYLRTKSPVAEEAAREALRGLHRQAEGIVTVELWETGGRHLLSAEPDLPRIAGEPAVELGEWDPGRDTARVGEVRLVDSTLLYPAIVAVRDRGTTLGYVVQGRRIAVTQQAARQLGDLIGSDALILLGGGSVWTDFATVVSPPPVAPLPRDTLLEYERPGAGARLAWAAAVPGTPWLAVVEVPRDRVLARARRVLGRLALIALGLLMLGAAGATALSRSLTRPIAELAAAADAVAAGDYGRRIESRRGDEIGQLAVAFNAMAQRVEEARRGLERQVAERTAALEDALRQVKDNESRLAQIFASLPVAIYVVDHTGRPRYVNRLSTKILGRGIAPDASAEELAAVHQAYRVSTGQPYPGDEQPIVHALKGRPAHAADFEIRRPGGPVHIEVWAAPVFGDDGRLAFAVAAFIDITERERARAEIERLNAELAQRITELEAANRELDTFSYSVSHDLRAPLRAIDGFSRILLEDYAGTLDAEARRLLGVVRANTSGMGQLIDDLLAFSRLSRQPLEPAPVNMRSLARAAAEDARASAGPGAERAAVEIGDMPVVRGDGALLRQVWVNLIGNALKFSRTSPSPRVEIGATNGAGETVFFVRDNGVGFDMAYADKLFGVFQRLHRPDEFEGTGVGLAIVRRVVARHGGRVWAEGEPDRGATFYFAIPTAGGRA
jgi:PAS domain S-box-containing protein